MPKLEVKKDVVKGVCLCYVKEGSGPKLCYLQGWGPFEASHWLIEELSKHYTVYAPDIFTLRNVLKQPFHKSCIEFLSEWLKKK